MSKASPKSLQIILKIDPFRNENRFKNDEKSIPKSMQNVNASWHRFLIDFGWIWKPKLEPKWSPNRLKIGLRGQRTSQDRHKRSPRRRKTARRPLEDRAKIHSERLQATPPKDHPKEPKTPRSHTSQRPSQENKTLRSVPRSGNRH